MKKTILITSIAFICTVGIASLIVLRPDFKYMKASKTATPVHHFLNIKDEFQTSSQKVGEFILGDDNHPIGFRSARSKIDPESRTYKMVVEPYKLYLFTFGGFNRDILEIHKGDQIFRDSALNDTCSNPAYQAEYELLLSAILKECEAGNYKH